MSQDIEDTPDPRSGFGVLLFAGCSSRGSGWAAGGLVVAGGVEGEFAEEFACGGVDDADVEVLDEHQDAGSGVGPADADVVEAAAVAEGELAVLPVFLLVGFPEPPPEPGVPVVPAPGSPLVALRVCCDGSSASWP